jgi:NTE family protein
MNRRTLRTIVVGLTGLALAAGVPRAACAQDAQATRPRPRVGLALGGGSARGIAHIGVLKWLDEHRVPIDLVAGTSAGGLIGGAFASGMDPAELTELVRTTDWGSMFAVTAPFESKTFRRKEDARAFPAQIHFGLKGGFKLPSGLNAGQQVQMLLDRLSLPYYDLASFDDLPTPFRAVATDLRRSETVVFDRGRLARALRATMAIPGVFTPVADGDRLLVDGGTLDNVPADVVREAGSDVVIAVNVAPDYDESELASDLFAVVGSAIDTMMSANTRRALAAADLVIDPDLKGLYSLDWRKSDELIDRGYKAAEAVREQLLHHQVDEVAYAAWRATRAAKRRADLPQPVGVAVEGVTAAEAHAIRAEIERRIEGRPLTIDAIERGALAIAGTDRYQVVSYHLDPAPGGANLAFEIQPKTYGPPFLLPALDLRNTDSTNFAANLRARLAMYDTFITGSELRLDLGVGTRETAALEVYRRLGESPVFVAPRGYFERYSINAYDEDGALRAEYRETRAGGGLDVGIAGGQRSEVRAGFDIADVRIGRRVGEPSLLEAKGTEQVASLRWTFDGQDNAVVPSRGAYLRSALRYYIETPAIVDPVTGSRFDGPRDLVQGEARVTWAHRIGRRERVFAIAAGGTSSGDDAGVNRFRLGGPFNLGGYNNDSIVGDTYVLATAGVLHEWFRLPDLIGGGAYLGAWIENGSAFDRWEDAKYYGCASTGFIAETLFGPIFVGGSVNFEGHPRFYVALGSLWR